MASAPFDHKALQLAELKRMGAPLPRTLVTNFPDAARIFVDDLHAHQREAIVKPSAGGAEAQLVDDAVRARLPLITSSPVIVQERVVGDDVRVTVVGDRVVSSVIIESDTLDYRTGAAYRTGGAVYRAHALPAEVSALCVSIARAFSHVLSGIDLKRTPKGYVVLEANSGPVYLDIEHKTGAAVTDAIVQWLDERQRARNASA
jgi:glutathione synthase/RimK-type ligase-like ATP-grasp enzyme